MKIPRVSQRTGTIKYKRSKKLCEYSEKWATTKADAPQNNRI